LYLIPCPKSTPSMPHEPPPCLGGTHKASAWPRAARVDVRKMCFTLMLSMARQLELGSFTVSSRLSEQSQASLLQWVEKSLSRCPAAPKGFCFAQVSHHILYCLSLHHGGQCHQQGRSPAKKNGRRLPGGVTTGARAPHTGAALKPTNSLSRGGRHAVSLCCHALHVERKKVDPMHRRRPLRLSMASLSPLATLR